MPAAKTTALGALLFFGFAMAYAWVESARHSRGTEAAINKLEQQRQKLQRELRRHREALDELADGMDQMILRTDTNQVITYANRSAIEKFKVMEPEGQTILALTLSSELSNVIDRVISSGEPQRVELTLRHPEERIAIVSVWHETSKLSRIFIAIHDITPLRRLERVRRDFVANVSHELRTPMTTIRAMAETIEEDIADNEPEALGYLHKIIREVDRLTDITSDLLTLSQAESGIAAKTTVDFTEVAQSIIEQLRPRASEKGLDLQLIAPPDCKVLANEGQLTQVALNLIGNAINYTSDGHVQVRLSEEPNWIVMDVEDTGIGIAQEHQSRIFERFYRVDKGRSRATGGTGLGLSIVRHIVDTHNGKIELKSELNKGSTFTVRLPRNIDPPKV